MHLVTPLVGVALLGAGPRTPVPELPILNWEPRSDWISVKAHGATGDGKTDDTAAIQKVLDKFKPGDSVYFPPATYRVTRALYIRSKDNPGRHQTLHRGPVPAGCQTRGRRREGLGADPPPVRRLAAESTAQGVSQAAGRFAPSRRDGPAPALSRRLPRHPEQSRALALRAAALIR